MIAQAGFCKTTTSLLLFVLLLFCLSPLAEAHSVNLKYEGGNSRFANVGVQISPNLQTLSFDTWGGKRVIMDCKRTTEDSVWTCKSTCSTGEVSLAFSIEKGFDSFEIAKLDFTPRLCNGNASRLDRPVKIEKPLKFRLLKISRDS